jgi:hypothetical protein
VAGEPVGPVDFLILGSVALVTGLAATDVPRALPVHSGEKYRTMDALFSRPHTQTNFQKYVEDLPVHRAHHALALHACVPATP